MEETYLLMFLLVIFGVAIYVIIQMPEVKDYIAPPSGNYGSVTIGSNTSNTLSNTLSNSLSNSLSNIVTLSNYGSNYSNIVTLSNTLSNYGSNYSNIINGTPLSGDPFDRYYILQNLEYSLLNDGSVSQEILSNNNGLTKLSYLSSSKTSTLSDLIILDLNSGNYQTIEQISDHVKNYVLSNIPPITTSNLIAFNQLNFNAAMSDSNFTKLYFSIFSIPNSFDNYPYLLNYTTNWYLSHLATATPSNFIQIASAFIINNILSNNSNI